MGASLILEKLFSRSSFYYIDCFSILATGPHLDATITSGNIVPVLMLLYLFVDHLYACFS